MCVHFECQGETSSPPTVWVYLFKPIVGKALALSGWLAIIDYDFFVVGAVPRVGPDIQNGHIFTYVFCIL